MKWIIGIENTTRLPSDRSNNVFHILEEQIHLGSILLLLLSGAAAFTVPDYLLFDAYTSSDIFPHFRWYQFRQLSHSTPFDLYVTFLLQHGHKPFFFSSICCISVPTGISCLRANSYSSSHKFARITARDAPIPEPSTCTYHESLHLKYTLLTAIFKSLFMVARWISGGDSWLYSFCEAISIYIASSVNSFVWLFDLSIIS